MRHSATSGSIALESVTLGWELRWHAFLWDYQEVSISIGQAPVCHGVVGAKQMYCVAILQGRTVDATNQV